MISCHLLYLKDVSQVIHRLTTWKCYAFLILFNVEISKGICLTYFSFNMWSSFHAALRVKTPCLACLNWNILLHYVFYASCLLAWCTFDVFSSIFWSSFWMSMHSIVSLCFNVLNCADPNRPGMHMKLIKFLLKLKAPRIVYVSCNPATCARDLDYLCHGVVCVSFWPPVSLSSLSLSLVIWCLKLFCRERKI